MWSSLNNYQREAVLHDKGPQLVLACGGSGKSHSMVTKIAHLISNGVQPSRIKAITFTKDASVELKSRVQKLAGNDINVEGVDVRTIHSFCYKIISHQIMSRKK